MPFSIEQFFEVFARYNLAVWPLQIVAFLAGIVVVLLLWSNSRGGAAMIAVTLSAMWLVNGIGYHWLYFSTINPAARLFAGCSSCKRRCWRSWRLPDLRCGFARAGDRHRCSG